MSSDLDANRVLTPTDTNTTDTADTTNIMDSTTKRQTSKKPKSLDLSSLKQMKSNTPDNYEDIAFKIVSPGLPPLSSKNKSTVLISKSIELQQKRLILERASKSDTIMASSLSTPSSSNTSRSANSCISEDSPARGSPNRKQSSIYSEREPSLEPANGSNQHSLINDGLPENKPFKRSRAPPPLRIPPTAASKLTNPLIRSAPLRNPKGYPPHLYQPQQQLPYPVMPMLQPQQHPTFYSPYMIMPPQTALVPGFYPPQLQYPHSIIPIMNSPVVQEGNRKPARRIKRQKVSISKNGDLELSESTSPSTRKQQQQQNVYQVQQQRAKQLQMAQMQLQLQAQQELIENSRNRAKATYSPTQPAQELPSSKRQPSISSPASDISEDAFKSPVVDVYAYEINDKLPSQSGSNQSREQSHEDTEVDDDDVELNAIEDDAVTMREKDVTGQIRINDTVYDYNVETSGDLPVEKEKFLQLCGFVWDKFHEAV